MVVAVIRGGDGVRFRYRRAGGEFVAAFGRDPSGGFLDEMLPVRGGCRDYRDAQALAGLIIRVPPRITSATRPGAMASQLPAAAKAPAAAQLLDDSASAKVAMREEI